MSCKIEVATLTRVRSENTMKHLKARDFESTADMEELGEHFLAHMDELELGAVYWALAEAKRSRGDVWKAAVSIHPKGVYYRHMPVEGKVWSAKDRILAVKKVPEPVATG